MARPLPCLTRKPSSTSFLIELSTEVLLNVGHIRAHFIDCPQRDVCIGRTRGGKNTKIHDLVNRERIPVCLSISAGNCSDCDQAIPLLQKFGKIKGSNILSDWAYGTKKIRLYLTEQGAQYTIPPTRNLLHPWKYDRQIYKRRNVIERCFCRLKDFRRISTRHDKRADSFQAFLFLAASAVIFSILHI